MTRHCLTLTLVVVLFFSAGVFAADPAPAQANWPRFGGPNGDFKSPMTGIRKDWSGGLKKIWEVKDLSPDGCTWSAPSVQGNRLIVLGQHVNQDWLKGNKDAGPHTDTVYCFDADKGGAPLWKTDFEDPYLSDYGWGSGPASTPTIDGDKVFVAGRTGSVLCLSMADGKILWQTKATMACHGYNASFLVWDDLLIIPGMIRAKYQFSLLGAVKKATGEKVWSFGDDGKAHGGDNADYGAITPIRVTFNGVDQILYSSGTAVYGVDGNTGKLLWEQSTVKEKEDIRVQFCGPVMSGSYLYITRGHQAPLGMQADKGQVKEIWRGFTGGPAKIKPSVSKAVSVDGFFYTCIGEGLGLSGDYSGRGFLSCVDPKTGQIKWSQDIGNGTPILIDGCLLVLTFAGNLFLVQPSPDGFRKITEWKGAVPPHEWMYRGKKYKKESAPVWVGPVAARGKLYLRYDDTLTCYDLMK